jgi:acyl-coenzyme A thioesterase PaaI-like protein
VETGSSVVRRHVESLDPLVGIAVAGGQRIVGVTRLDPEDLGPEVGEDPATERAPQIRQVDDPEPMERSPAIRIVQRICATLAAVSDASAPAVRTGPHIIAELGLHTAFEGGAVAGRAEVVPEACIPGTDVLRTSVLATWSDVVTGFAAGHAVQPRIPLTLDLEVQVVEPPRAGMTVVSKGTVTKLGRTVVVTETPFIDEATGTLLAVSFVTFVPSPNPEHVFEGGTFPESPFVPGRLAEPLAERAGARVVERGVVEMARRTDGLNATGAIQGGLVGLAAEEAASSLADEPVVLHAFQVRYLRSFNIGPARAVAEGSSDFSVVRLTDLGTGKLGATATARGTRLARL